MKVLLIFISLSFLNVVNEQAFAGPSHSHHGHGPKINEKEAQSLASSKVKDLVKLSKIDSTWSQQSPNAPFKKDYGKGDEWVVTFDNDSIKDPKKKKLYVFISLWGKVIAANFTGQ